MIGLDTNVLVRYIAQDDPVQSPKATRLIESLAADELGYVSLVSVVELVWVLTGCYSSAKAEICIVLETLLRTKEFIVENADVAWKALRLFKASNADFSDCLIERSANGAGCGYTATFDRDAVKNCWVKLVGQIAKMLWLQEAKMGILIMLAIAVVAIFALYWVTVGAFRLLLRLLGLPKYRDVVVPSKYDFKTVVEFDNPVAQYVYDLMAGFKHVTEDGGIKLGLSFVFFAALGAMVSFVWVLVIAVITLWFLLWASPSAMRAEKRRAKRFKDCTTEDWHKTHLWAMKSELRQQEMASAIRRSGVGGLHR